MTLRPRDHQRPVGLTQAAGYEIGVSRSFSCTREHAWQTLTGGRGLATWLGPVNGLEPTRGSTYETKDGTVGEVRSYRPLDRIRLTWRPPSWRYESTVQVALSPSGQKTVVRFHQERLSTPAEREQMRRHWRQVLDDLAPLLEPDGSDSPPA